jgi:hypothetical protein
MNWRTVAQSQRRKALAADSTTAMVTVSVSRRERRGLAELRLGGEESLEERRCWRRQGFGEFREGKKHRRTGRWDGRLER